MIKWLTSPRAATRAETSRATLSEFVTATKATAKRIKAFRKSDFNNKGVD